MWCFTVDVAVMLLGIVLALVLDRIVPRGGYYDTKLAPVLTKTVAWSAYGWLGMLFLGGILESWSLLYILVGVVIGFCLALGTVRRTERGSQAQPSRFERLLSSMKHALEMEELTGERGLADSVADVAQEQGFDPQLVREAARATRGAVGAELAKQPRGVVVTEKDVLPEVLERQRARNAGLPQVPLIAASDLTIDDFVVHADHGIGRYRGLKHLKMGDSEGDYLHIEYAKDRLYMPVDRLGLICKFIGAGEPALDVLATLDWEKVDADIIGRSVLDAARKLRQQAVSGELMLTVEAAPRGKQPA